MQNPRFDVENGPAQCFEMKWNVLNIIKYLAAERDSWSFEWKFLLARRKSSSLSNMSIVTPLRKL